MSDKSAESRLSLFSDISDLKAIVDHPVSRALDALFSSVDLSGESMTEKDDELVLDGSEEFELGDLNDTPFASTAETAEDVELNIDLSAGDDGEFSLVDSISTSPEHEIELLESHSEEADGPQGDGGYGEISLIEESDEIDPVSLAVEADLSLEGPSDPADPEFRDMEPSSPIKLESDISDDAKKKLMEIDDILVEDASLASIPLPESLDNSLSSDDLDLDSISFSSGSEELKIPIDIGTPKPINNQVKGFEDISGAYSGEMERTQATLSNLRADRKELLEKIQKLESELVLQNRQMLTVNAELDERKIELSIIRKKLNGEISDLKDKFRIQEERKLILEEKNKVLLQELDKAGQKNKIDVKKIQMRESELEQKLELLKSDAETQIRNRDLKILELKRKIDAMEFDMESISAQEKRSVENRFELEDKLDKAIKTLRTAISDLEEETDRSSALNALKKNIDA